MTEKTCFVIGPIGPEASEIRRHADWLLEGIIAPVVMELGFQAVRADKIATPGMIDSQVINHVIGADLVVADLSSWNANAFYELGLRHMAEGPVIHMIDRSNQDIPFDVKPYRTILFGWTSPKELEQSKEDLKAQVRAVLHESHTVDNPVIRARGQINLRETASPREQEMLSMMEDLRSQVAKMQSDLVAERRMRTTRDSVIATLNADRKRAVEEAELELAERERVVEKALADIENRAAVGPTGLGRQPNALASTGLGRQPNATKR
jgi:hypothetical protein